MQTAFAEENQDLSSHLAFVEPENSGTALESPQLTSSPITSAASVATSEIQPALAQNDIWQRIRNGFAMRDLNSKLISRHEKWYSSHPEYVARM